MSVNVRVIVVTEIGEEGLLEIISIHISIAIYMVASMIAVVGFVEILYSLEHVLNERYSMFLIVGVMVAGLMIYVMTAGYYKWMERRKDRVNEYA